MDSNFTFVSQCAQGCPSCACVMKFVLILPLGSLYHNVQMNFVVVQYVELGLIVIAAFTAVAQKNRFWLSGITLGVLLHAPFLLAFDLVAERRGAAYLAAIEAQSNRK
jgi:hypothetical protein